MIGPLHLVATKDITTLSQYITPSGNWNLSLFEEFFPVSVCLQVVKIMAPSALSEPDKLAWNLSPSGEFSMASAMQVVSTNQEESPSLLWNLIWKWKGQERIRAFLWLVGHNRLPTNDLCHHRKILEYPTRPLCQEHSETTLHALRDCPFASRVWSTLLRQVYGNNFFNLTWKSGC